jgi:hypothetical protein
MFLNFSAFFRIPEFSGDLPREKNQERAQGGIELMTIEIQILSSTSTPHLPYMKIHKIQGIFLIIQLHVLIIRVNLQ